MTRTYAIRAEGLSKRYIVGKSADLHDSIRHLLADRFKAVFSRRRDRGSGTEFWALRDVGFEIARGENVGVIGLNGAGKSTLLKILSRITEPTTGRALIDGRIGALLEVGTGFHNELTGRENTFLYGSILGMRREEVARKFDAIVEFAGIAQHIDTPIKRYSSGMTVRLAFAVAAHLEPEILFLDEVLAVGDLSFQRKCMNLAKQLQQRDATILFVSHNMFSIKTMCERVIYLREGRIEYDGSVDEGIEIYERDCRLSVLPGHGLSDPAEWPLYITECEVTDPSGARKSMFDVGDRVRVRVAYEVRRPVSHPNFMVSFVRADGVTVCTYSTEVDGIDLGRVADDGFIQLDLPPLKLVAEMYSVHVTVREQGFHEVLCRQIGATFHVRDSLLDLHFGVFHEAGEWLVGRRSAPATRLSDRSEDVSRIAADRF